MWVKFINFGIFFYVLVVCASHTRKSKVRAVSGRFVKALPFCLLAVLKNSLEWLFGCFWPIYRAMAVRDDCKITSTSGTSQELMAAYAEEDEHFFGATDTASEPVELAVE